MAFRKEATCIWTVTEVTGVDLLMERGHRKEKTNTESGNWGWRKHIKCLKKDRRTRKKKKTGGTE